MKTILFGKSGLVGTEVYSSLIEKNIVVEAPSSSEANLSNLNNLKDYFSTYSKTKSELNIILVASNMPYKGEVHDDYSLMRLNLDFVENIIQATLDCNVNEFLYISTIDVYGQQVDCMTEESKLNPKSKYSIFKLSSEFLLKSHCHKRNIPFLCLRLSHILGENDTSPKVVNAFLDSAIKTGQIQVTGNPLSCRDFVYVKDVGKIVADLSGKKITDTVNVASGNSVTLIELAEMIKKILPEVKIIQSNENADLVSLNFDISKLRIYTDIEFAPLQDYILHLYNSRNI